jgi:Guanylate-binding protein, N-terminal domain
VIDTEGLGALDRDTNYDSRIFSLAVLVASCFLYNSVGNIDEQALELLSFVVNLTKQIQIRANPNEDVDFEDYAQHFPSFLWILRDFSLQLLGQDGETLTSRV